MDELNHGNTVAEIVTRVLLYAVPMIIAITLHEAAHGWVANRLGDSTAKDAGRLSLNPLRHVDPIGTVVVPLLLLASGGFLFGWAKPVPIQPHRLGSPRRDMALVALAGPGANMLMAVGWALIAHLAYAFGQSLGQVGIYTIYLSIAGVTINLVLAVLNMLPIPPLDGGRVLVSILPPRAARAAMHVERFGIVIVLVLLATGLLGRILWPPIAYLQNLLI